MKNPSVVFTSRKAFKEGLYNSSFCSVKIDMNKEKKDEKYSDSNKNKHDSNGKSSSGL